MSPCWGWFLEIEVYYREIGVLDWIVLYLIYLARCELLYKQSIDLYRIVQFYIFRFCDYRFVSEEGELTVPPQLPPQGENYIVSCQDTRNQYVTLMFDNK